MIEAVVFDLDGLLVDSELIWHRVRRDLFRKYHAVWRDEDQALMMGVSTAHWSHYMADKLQHKLTPAQIREAVTAAMAACYRAGEVPLLPGADEAVRYCAGHLRTGLASGSPLRLIDAAIAGSGWQSCFRQIVSSDEVGRGKPAPDVYLEVCQRLQVDPSETLVFEDSGAGIRAARAAGVRVIAVPNRDMPPSPEILRMADLNLVSLAGYAEAMEAFIAQT